MPDMLVKLYALPSAAGEIATQAAQGVTIRRAIAPEKHFVLDWAERHFSRFWRSECDAAFSRDPVACWLAVDGDSLVGFACYDATARGFFGPTGVLESQRGRGVGRALLIVTLQAMRDVGYGYAIIGGVGPADFYAKAVGATVIPDSSPGVYAGMLRKAE